MSLKLFGPSSVIAFSANQRIPYGNQITVLGPAPQQTGNAFSALLPNNTFGHIQIEGSEAHIGSFIVMRSEAISKQRFKHLGVDSNSMDQYSERIENDLIKELIK
jgi:hypothetical protein